MSSLNNIYQSSSGSANVTAELIGVAGAFKNTCNTFLVRSYYHLMNLKKVNNNWEEDTFTANFKVILEMFFDLEEIPYVVAYQEHQITKEILDGVARAQTAKKMDIVFETFSRPKLKYGIEAKIISEKNYSSRNAKKLCKEYIVSGIDRFVNKTYNMDGCIIGYVMNGNIDNVIKMINTELASTNRAIEIIGLKHTIGNYDYCYTSTHLNFSLQHLFFQF